MGPLLSKTIQKNPCDYTHTHTRLPKGRHILLGAKPGRLGETNETDEVLGKFDTPSKEVVVDKRHHHVIERRRCVELRKGKGWNLVDIHWQCREHEAVGS